MPGKVAEEQLKKVKNMKIFTETAIALKRMVAILTIVVIVAGTVAILASRKSRRERSVAEAVSDRSVSVSTSRVERGAIELAFSANGITQPVRELSFTSDVSGRVTEILVEKGVRVSQGTPLLKVDSELLKADYTAAEAAWKALAKDVERLSRSHAAGGVSEQQLDALRTQLIAAESRLSVSRRRYEDATVKSPVSGIVNARHVEPGALIAPNSPLFEIIDDSRVKLLCLVPDSRVALLSQGAGVTAESSEGVFSGRVTHIGRKADRSLHHPVEVLLDRDGRLRAGMYLKVTFCGEQSREAILIPRSAVSGSAGAGAVAYVAVSGKASRRVLTLGDMRGDSVEVLDGLGEGEEIIVSGLMNVYDGAQLKTVNHRTSSANRSEL